MTKRFAKQRARRMTLPRQLHRHGPERLEPRLVLSGSSHPNTTDSSALADVDNELDELAVNISAADDNYFSTAQDLGTLATAWQIDNSVGRRDISDVYQFELTGIADVTVGLTGLQSDIDVFPSVSYFGGQADWSVNSINAPESWAVGYTGSGVVVAIVDTGIDLGHVDLDSNIWTNRDEIPGNGIDDDRNGYTDDLYGWDFSNDDNHPRDGNNHGTHVAGIIAAENNGIGATGIAFNATVMPVQVLSGSGSGSSYDVAAGIRYAVDNGADVINLSLGSGGVSRSIHSALAYAQQQNVFVVAAAGNNGGSSPNYPARFAESLTNVISVGAYSQSNRIASFSNDVGATNTVQVDAPGVGVYSTISGNGYAYYSGTSMAAPQVAGLAALALSANPNLTASQLRDFVERGADRDISQSDAVGGVNAAITVAQARASSTSHPSSANASNANAIANNSQWTLGNTTSQRRMKWYTNIHPDFAAEPISQKPVDQASIASHALVGANASHVESDPVVTDQLPSRAIESLLVREPGSDLADMLANSLSRDLQTEANLDLALGEDSENDTYENGRVA